MPADNFNSDAIEDTVEGFDATVDDARKGAKSFTATAAEGVNKLVDKGADGVKAMADSAPEASDWVTDKLEDLRERARAEPLKLLAIATAVGALFGAFLTR